MNRAIMMSLCAASIACTGVAAAQSDRAVGILTGEERAQYDATLSFCGDRVNRDTNRCRRFERSFPDALPARQPERDAAEAATAED